MEYFKWNAIVRSTKITNTNSIKLQSFFAGIITGMLTPNMQGNFLGRIYYFQRKERLPITLLTLTSNFAQFCVTILLGIIALTFSNFNSYSYLIIFISIVSLFFYFSFERLVFFKKRFKWYAKMQALLEQNKTLRWEFLFYSLLRNIVFSVQFLLALMAFGATVNLEIYLLIWVLYLFTTLSPSLIFGKLFVRESIALWLFSSLIPEPAIIAASFSIWIINLLLPTLLGLIICKRKVK